jgi:outer membrane protein assembly factor BamB
MGRIIFIFLLIVGTISSPAEADPGWKYKTDGRVYSTPLDGHLYALNKDSGEMVWKFASGGEKTYGLWDYYLSSPAVESNRVYWGSGDGHLYSVGLP